MGCLAVALLGNACYVRNVEKAGILYEVGVIRDRITLGLDPGPAVGNESSTVSRNPKFRQETAADYLDDDDDKYFAYINSLNPNSWKDQDHYKVLGLSKLRWKATVSQIRSAYRAKVLKHHPDKKQSNGEKQKEESYFACLTKAYEQLGVSEQLRRAYDSVDPTFDDTIPEEKDITEDNFFEVLSPVFERNARWSVNQPVPLLGNNETSREKLDNFYTFWYEWESWREFSYLDEEDKEKGEDRYERREIEKANKVERERRRKDELKRIRNLIDIACRKDPRIAAFRAAEKARKQKEKEIKRQRLLEKKMFEEMARKEAEIERQKREEEEKQAEMLKKEAEKRLKEKQKKQLAEARKRLRSLAMENEYWVTSEKNQFECMKLVEKMCSRHSADKLIELCNQLQSVEQHEAAIEILLDDEKKADERRRQVDQIENARKAEKKTMWTDDETSLVVKGANLFPAGTVQRWSRIAEYVNEHRHNKSSRAKSEKDVIQQVNTYTCA
ncbi:hypothetical protein AB6A40_005156 [Gnathostoma spinigerum]|uniref:DnaJ homolog subfamily C member 2 n=1 Tax=Gnathostoma spinigerum TaxID=75299 RepID=A0ABD6EGV1_9BILA